MSSDFPRKRRYVCGLFILRQLLQRAVGSAAVAKWRPTIFRTSLSPPHRRRICAHTFGDGGTRAAITHFVQYDASSLSKAHHGTESCQRPVATHFSHGVVATKRFPTAQRTPDPSHRQFKQKQKLSSNTLFGPATLHDLHALGTTCLRHAGCYRFHEVGTFPVGMVTAFKQNTYDYPLPHVCQISSSETERPSPSYTMNVVDQHHGRVGRELAP